jgi:U-box domain
MVQERNAGDRRKRARMAEAVIVPLDETDDEDDEAGIAPCTPAPPACAAAPSAPSHLVTDSSSIIASAVLSPLSPSPPPLAFLCPLTRSIMFDPVLDREGNSFERSAILAYLKDHPISPISRRPLHPGRLVPNHAVRQLIHQYMGAEWVNRKRTTDLNQRTGDGSSQANGAPFSAPSSCPYRAKMSRVLEALAPGDVGGDAGAPPLRLTLNGEGSAAFRCQGVVVVLDVPRGVGMFHLYTRNLVLHPSRAVQRHMLELNFLQGTCTMLLVGSMRLRIACARLTPLCTTYSYTQAKRAGGACRSNKARRAVKAAAMAAAAARWCSRTTTGSTRLLPGTSATSC